MVSNRRAQTQRKGRQVAGPSSGKVHSPQSLSTDDRVDLLDSEDVVQQDTSVFEDDTQHEIEEEEPAGPSGKQNQGQVDRGAMFVSLLPSNLDPEALRNELTALPVKLKMDKQALIKTHRNKFPSWRLMLRQGFSLMFYGFGSKRMLMEDFAQSTLTDGGAVIFHGHLPGVTAKHILRSVANLYTHKSYRGVGCQELMEDIHRESQQRRMYVIINNIDGPGLRSVDDQAWLSQLSRCPGVHLAATIDHHNALLLWDHRTRMAFRWWLVACHTYATYQAETLDMTPLLSGAFHTSAKRGATTVLGSLTTNAQEVFRVLALHQLDDPEEEGVAFQLLYRMCRERFLVSSESTLSNHLKEFKDHELIKMKSANDGTQVMYIPFNEEALRKVLEEMDALVG